MKKHRRPITRLWRVAMVWRGGKYPTILVSKGPVHSKGHGNRGMIRACTAKAAGRRYARNNVALRIASADFETDNPFSRHELTKEELRRYHKYGKLASVKVVQRKGGGT